MARTPSVEAHEAVLAATLKLISVRGIEATSLDEIAQIAGVSKATIYKHWRTKDALCIEAIGRLRSNLPVFDSGDPRSDLTRLLRHFAATNRKEALGRIWQRIMNYAANNKSFAKAFRMRISQGHREALEPLLDSAVSKGQLRGDLDLDSAIDMLLGPIIYRRFMQEIVPPALVRTVVDSFWQANAPARKLPAKKIGKGRI